MSRMLRDPNQGLGRTVQKKEMTRRRERRVSRWSVRYSVCFHRMP